MMPDFPDWMKSQRRWLVRRTGDKKPFSPLTERPTGYVAKESNEPPNVWRRRWNQPAIWVTYEQATAFVRSNERTCEGLTFVLHPAGDTGNARVVCLDYDHALDANGDVFPEVRAMLDCTCTYGEWSRSGTGVHIFFLTQCDPFANIPQAKVNADGCCVDVLASNPVAVTGNLIDPAYSQVVKLPYSFLESQPWFVHKDPLTLSQGFDFHNLWWSQPEEPLGEHYGYLEAIARDWQPRNKNEGRSLVGFALACKLMRAGLIGWPAVRLMQLAPVNPPWSESEAVHKIQDAYLATIADGSFGRDAQLEEFGSIGTTAQPPADDAPRSYTIAELMRADLRLSWIVEPLLVDMQPLVIGGTEKTFKTGLTFDLLWSLATNTPWLGKFPACEHRSSIFFTAEIGMEATQDLARRVGEFKGIDPFGVHDMVVTSYLPMITRSKEGDTLKQFYSELDTRKPQIVAIDPLYLVSPDIETANPYLLSGILAKFSAICRERGIWLIVCHHSRQLNSGAVMSLQDLYGAGCGMFFRQWVLLSHATPYANGRADLNMAIGGSATGSRGQWRVEIDEGEAQELVASRHWRTTVTPAGDHAPDSLDQPMAEYLLSFYGDEPIDAAQLVKWTGFAKDDVATIQQGLAAAGLIRFAGTGFVRKNQQNVN